MKMSIRHQEPVFTIGKAPLVAGTIVHRSYLRARRRHERQLRWNALTDRLLFRQTRVKEKGRPRDFDASLRA